MSKLLLTLSTFVLLTINEPFQQSQTSYPSSDCSTEALALYQLAQYCSGQCDSSHTLSEMYAHHRWNNVTLPIVERTPGVQVMRVFRASAFAWDTHLTFGDCTHWCQPGVPDHWTELLLNSLMAGSSADDG